MFNKTKKMLMFKNCSYSYLVSNIFNKLITIKVAFASSSTSSLITDFNKKLNQQRTNYYVEADGTKKSVTG
jgi:hypothetical protein